MNIEKYCINKLTINNILYNIITFKLYISNEIMVGLLYVIIQNNICTITNLNIFEDYQHKGYGTFLLKYLINYCKENNINKILLDDMSSNFNKQNNIYLKNGFNYIINGFPEMEIDLNT